MIMGDGNHPYWDEGMRHAHDGWWSGPFHLIVFLVVLALLVAGAVWLARRLSYGSFAALPAAPFATAGVAPAASDPAVAALRMRYAAGEVSREEFQQALADLTGAADSAAGDAPAP